MRNYKLNGQVGIAGELRTMSELLLQGFNPAKSYLDKGVDIILDNGKKIQVKTSSRHFNNANRSNYYHFLIKPWDQKGRDKNRIRTNEVDFIICYCIEDNVFYIIPSKELQNKQGFELFPNKENSRSKYEIYREKWEVLA